MPRILVVCAIVLVGGCLFKADYDGVTFACSDSDNRCPSGMFCHDEVCVSSIPDAAIDATDAPLDAPPTLLTCGDPMPFPPIGGTVMGTTEMRTSTVASMCNGLVMNGPDAVHRIAVAAGKQLKVEITAGDRKAYVLQPCTVAPATPMCVGNVRAILGAPITVSPAAGTAYIIVDDELAAGAGTYTLKVSIP